MIPLSLAEIASAVGGTVGSGATDAVVTGPVVVDSRQVAPGALFVAVKGDRVDGHDYAAAAMAGGAAAVLAERDLPVPCVVVPDSVLALGRLARAVIDRLPDLHVLAVTGSSGKTSTKDILSQVLAGSGPTVAPKGSFNNEIGLPLTALQCSDSTRHLVVEMGARGAGHIRYLCDLTPPQIGLVTNVGSAHLGEFGSRSGVARAKGELVEALPGDGFAVLNDDDPQVAAMASRTDATVITFGTSPGARVRAERVQIDEQGRARFDLCLPDSGPIPVALQLHGEHQVANSLAAAAAATALGIAPAAIAERLHQAVAVSPWRMEVSVSAAGVTVVNDAYNANPDSVRAALNALLSMSRGGRTWAVLGEMGELGDESAHEHEAIGRLVASLGVDRLVVVGEGARPIHLGASRGGLGDASTWVPDIGSAVPVLQRTLSEGDVVLVKASRAQGLEKLAAALLAEAEGMEAST